MGHTDDIKLVNVCPYVNRQHWFTAFHQNILNWPSLFHFLLVYLPFFFLSVFHESFFLSVQLGINYVCCCKFSLFTTGSGLRGTVTHSKLFTCDCSKVENEPCTLQHISSSGFLMRTREDWARYFNSGLSRCSSPSFSVCLSFSTTHSAALWFA